MNHASFLAAIAAEPDDDGLRLVYADFLDDAGELGYADFVRAQVALASMDAGDDAYPETLARVRRSGVLTGHAGGEGRTWLRGARVQLRRGCIADIDARDRELFDPCSSWDMYPVETIRSGIYGDYEPLIGFDPLTRCRGLIVERHDEADYSRLMESGLPRLVNLRVRLGFCRRPENLADFRHPDLPCLDSLRFHGHPEFLPRLFASRHRPFRRVHFSAEAEDRTSDGYADHRT